MSSPAVDDCFAEAACVFYMQKRIFIRLNSTGVMRGGDEEYIKVLRSVCY